jgi:biotin carboxyl carrier protein
MHANGEIIAPIPGRIMDVKVKFGDPVTKGQTVATMEAMKMENNIISTIDGVVQEIRVQKDSEVATGEVIMIIG